MRLDSEFEQDSLHFDVAVQPLDLFHLSPSPSRRGSSSRRSRGREVDSGPAAELPPVDVQERVFEVALDGVARVQPFDQPGRRSRRRGRVALKLDDAAAASRSSLVRCGRRTAGRGRRGQGIEVGRDEFDEGIDMFRRYLGGGREGRGVVSCRETQSAGERQERRRGGILTASTPRSK